MKLVGQNYYFDMRQSICISTILDTKDLFIFNKVLPELKKVKSFPQLKPNFLCKQLHVFRGGGVHLKK